MQRVAAVFDIDQTLVQGYTERLFFRYLIRQGLLRIPQALAYLGGLVFSPQVRFEDKGYLEGMAAAEIAELARRCYQVEIAPRLSLKGVSCIREHQARGHAVILLTGSLSLLITPLQEDLGADWLIATELDLEDGRFTGRIKGIHPRGRNKLRLLQGLAQAQGWDLGHSYAYGDHMQDLHLFHHIGHPVAVNPGWRLKRLARRHRWPIRYF